MKNVAVISLLLATAKAAAGPSSGDPEHFQRCIPGKNMCAGNPMFAGGCCGQTVFTEGSPNNLNQEWQRMNMIQEGGEFLCQAGDTIDFGNGNVHDYYKNMWNNGMRDYFLTEQGGKGPEKFHDWFMEIVQFPGTAAKPNPSQFWIKTVFQSECLEERLPTRDTSGSKFTFCESDKECRGDEFRGGCCMRTEIVGGDIMDLDPETRDAYTKNTGICAPGNIRDYFEDQGKVNMLDYNRFLFEETKFRDGFMKEMPKKPESFDQWMEWASMDGTAKRMIEGWRNVWFMSECTAGGRGRGGKMMDMMDGDDGLMMQMGSTKIMIKMCATTVAASVAATVGAMTLY